MNEDGWLIVSSVLGVFLVMGLGAFCRQRRWLTRESDRSLASLAANVLLPSLFFDRIVQGGRMESLAAAWEPPLFGFLITAAGFLLAWLLARTLGKRVGLDTPAKQRSFAVCAGIANYGYIPLPLAEIFYPEAQVDLILHNVGVDLALWSIGIVVITGGTGGGDPPSWRRLLASPPLVAVAVAVSIKQLGWAESVPAAVVKSIGWLSDCAIPMGLLLSGAIIIDFVRDTDWRGAWRTIVTAVAFRQGIMPVLMLTAAGAFASGIEMRQVLVLQAAMPSAVFPIVLVRLYDRDTTTALRVVLGTSLSAVVLIPTWLTVGRWWLGV